ncbi:M28 family peptidase, partial [Phenylobacterium sp.]|uniref:M28 family peptidase n=1 Tax=Phenylobacterium sp. TaxID=1871053 RepID=UPI002E32F22D
MSLRPALTALALAGLAAGGAWAAPRSAGIKDPDTRAWWQIAEALSSDAMEGRDIGSPGYDRAADVVVQRFKAAGLKPGGDNGGWFQVFKAHEISVEKGGTWLSWFPNTADVGIPLGFLSEITVRPTDGLPSRVQGPLTFRGYCTASDLKDAKGKVVLCFNTKRAGLASAGQRIAAASAADAAGLIQVDDPYFTIEPPRWPAAYARSVTIAGAPPPPAPTLPVMTMSAPAFVKLAKAAGQDGEAILKLGSAKQPLPSFDPPSFFRAEFNIAKRDYTAKNVLAVLPGRDPKLAAEHLVLSAHLDGYGYGEPVNGDGLYNGALDDAAYVGTLIRFADKHKGKPLRRSVLLAAFTGEEKGLLGAHWFVDHPTVPKASIVADINLDQLRPLFPLTILTELAEADSSLGHSARLLASSMNIRIQADPEPERGLLQRADHWPFMQA